MSWETCISEKLTYEVLRALHLVKADLESQPEPRLVRFYRPSGDVLNFCVQVPRIDPKRTELSLRLKLHCVCCPTHYLKLTTEYWDGHAWGELPTLTGPLVEFDKMRIYTNVKQIWGNAEIVTLL